MLIKALTDYYDILAQEGKVPYEGFSAQNIHYKVMLNSDGTIEDILNCQEKNIIKDKKGKEKIIYEPVNEIFPARNQKPGIAAEILEHRPKYLFGLSYNSKNDTLVVEKEKKSEKLLFDYCKETNLDFIEGVNSEVALAYKAFLENWSPENEKDNTKLKELGKNLDKSNFSIALSGNPKNTLHRDKAVMAKWSEMQNNRNVSENTVTGVCSVTGKANQPIARTHKNKIKGILGGQPTGCVLIGTNNTAEESYGKIKAFNSGISEECASKYTKALNYLLSDNQHKALVDDMTVVFWAEDNNSDECSDIFAQFFNDKEDAETVNLNLKKVFEYLKEGKKPDIKDYFENLNSIFYVVGMTPNSSRISIRFVYRNSFGNILEGICRYYEDIMLENTEKQILLWMLKKELVSPKSKNEKIPPNLLTDIFKAILWGQKFPNFLLNTVVRRVKTDKFENYVRVGILKACINRQKGKDDIKMALDKTNDNPAYLCGRLFALLEEIQRRAAYPAKLNRTIKDAYYASACSNPSRVFPTVMKLSEHHISKIENPVWFEKIKGEILDKLGQEFPGTLNLTEQGTFIIGYYQQKQDFYSPKKEEEK